MANIAWPEELASLDMVVSTANGLLGPEMGPGTQTFDIKSPGMVYTQWFGTAQGPLDTGVYSMNIQFVPAGRGSAAAVLDCVAGLRVDALHLAAPSPVFSGPRGHDLTASRPADEHARRPATLADTVGHSSSVTKSAHTGSRLALSKKSPVWGCGSICP